MGQRWFFARGPRPRDGANFHLQPHYAVPLQLRDPDKTWVGGGLPVVCWRSPTTWFWSWEFLIVKIILGHDILSSHDFGPEWWDYMHLAIGSWATSTFPRQAYFPSWDPSGQLGTAALIIILTSVLWWCIHLDLTSMLGQLLCLACWCHISFLFISTLGNIFLDLCCVGQGDGLGTCRSAPMAAKSRGWEVVKNSAHRLGSRG